MAQKCIERMAKGMSELPALHASLMPTPPCHACVSHANATLSRMPMAQAAIADLPPLAQAPTVITLLNCLVLLPCPQAALR